MRRRPRKKWTNGWNTTGDLLLWMHSENVIARQQRLNHWSFHNELGYKVPKFFSVLWGMKIDSPYHLLLHDGNTCYKHVCVVGKNAINSIDLSFFDRLFSHRASIVSRCKNCSFMLWHPWFVPLPSIEESNNRFPLTFTSLLSSWNKQFKLC